jgi:hypothetical protein
MLLQIHCCSDAALSSGIFCLQPQSHCSQAGVAHLMPHRNACQHNACTDAMQASSLMLVLYRLLWLQPPRLLRRRHVLLCPQLFRTALAVLGAEHMPLLPPPLWLLLLRTWPYRSSKRRQQESNMTRLSILYSARRAPKLNYSLIVIILLTASTRLVLLHASSPSCTLHAAQHRCFVRMRAAYMKSRLAD